MKKWLKQASAAKYIDLGTTQFAKYEQQGLIKPKYFLTISGKYEKRYSADDLDAMFITPDEAVKKISNSD